MRTGKVRRLADRRAGFTMVEILVVISIMAVLMALTASAVMRMTGVQQENNTNTTLRYLSSLLDKQWKIVVDQSMNPNSKTDPPTNVTAVTAVIPATIVGTPATDQEAQAEVDKRSRIIYTKLKLRQEFPMNFWEVLNPAPMGGNPIYQKTLNDAGITAPTLGNGNAAPNKWESAVCLWMALKQSRSGIALNMDDLGPAALVDVRDPLYGAVRPGLKAFVDGFGEPLHFYRWPTGNTDLNATVLGTRVTPESSEEDRLLAVPGWVNSPGGNRFRQFCHALPVGGNNAYKLVPVIAAGGRDKVLAVQQTAPQVRMSRPDPMTLIAGSVNGRDDTFSYRLR